jgi:hypothetical protein
LPILKKGRFAYLKNWWLAYLKREGLPIATNKKREGLPYLKRILKSGFEKGRFALLPKHLDTEMALSLIGCHSGGSAKATSDAWMKWVAVPIWKLAVSIQIRPHTKKSATAEKEGLKRANQRPQKRHFFSKR